MFCVNCGNEIADGAKFCPNCGHASGSGATQENVTIAKREEDSESNRPRTVKREYLLKYAD